jgi:hypothetical protein
MSHEPDKLDGKGSRWVRVAWIFIALLVVYPLSTGPMVYVVAKLNGGSHSVRWPLSIIVVPYTPFYRALNHAPKPIFRVWEKYDTFFWDLATKP